MVFVLALYLLLWAVWTAFAFLRLRNPRIAVVVSLGALSLSIVGVVAGFAVSPVTGETAPWFMGPAIVLAALRLTPAVRRVRGVRRAGEADG